MFFYSYDMDMQVINIRMYNIQFLVNDILLLSKKHFVNREVVCLLY